MTRMMRNEILGWSLLAATLVLLAGAVMAEEQHLRQACRADVQTLCPGVKPGGGRIIACLKDNADKVSDGCKTALAEAKAMREQKQGGAAN